MGNGALAAVACIALLLFGCTAEYRNEQALLPVPPKPPLQPFYGKPALHEEPPAPRQIEGALSGHNNSSGAMASPIPTPAPATDVTQVHGPGGMAPNITSLVEPKKSYEPANPALAQVYYFYSPLCPYSLNVGQKVESLEQEFGNATEWHKIDVTTYEGYSYFEKTLAEEGVPRSQMAVPMAFAGGFRLTGQQEILELFPKALQNITG